MIKMNSARKKQFLEFAGQAMIALLSDNDSKQSIKDFTSQFSSTTNFGREVATQAFDLAETMLLEANRRELI